MNTLFATPRTISLLRQAVVTAPEPRAAAALVADGGSGIGCGLPLSAPATPPATRSRQYRARALREPQAERKVGG